jgi:hypothetical protein
VGFFLLRRGRVEKVTHFSDLAKFVNELYTRAAKVTLPTSSLMLVQNELLTYRLRSSLMTRRPRLLSIDCLFESERSDVGDSPPGTSPNRARMSADPATAGVTTPCSSTCAPRLWTTPSSLRSRASNSASGGFLDFRGARPGPGKTHSIAALTQLAHGFSLLHLTLRRRHVTQLRGFKRGAVAVFVVAASALPSPFTGAAEGAEGDEGAASSIVGDSSIVGAP